MSSKRKIRKDDLEGYDSSFEDDEEGSDKQEKRTRRADLTEKDVASPIPSGSKVLPSKEYFQRELTRAESYKNRYFALNAFERHRKLVNDYFLYHPGAADKLLKRDTSKDKRDIDIIRENHRFLWNSDEEPDTWEKQLAKRYYDKLFKEYCICDLSRYKENKVAMRWRTENELVEGKGQFACGARKCANTQDLRTWEVNFAYVEDSEKKNALVKLRLCPECSMKLNYGKKCREVVKKSKKHSSKRDSRRRHSKEKHSSSKRKHHDNAERVSPDNNLTTDNQVHETPQPGDETSSTLSENIWKEPLVAPEMKSREEEFEEYLDDLFI